MLLLGAQAAFGRGALAVSGFCIYVSLALGLLGSALAFPFGIFVVICQRNPEKYIQARSLLPQPVPHRVGVTGLGLKTTPLHDSWRDSLMSFLDTAGHAHGSFPLQRECDSPLHCRG